MGDVVRDVMRFNTVQSIAVGAASAASAAFGSQTYAIRVCSTVAAYIKVGDGTPIAAATETYLPPNWAEYIQVTPGQKVAAIQAVGAGTMSVTELTT